MNRKLALLVVVAVASLAAASTAGATHTGQVCRSFKQNGHTYTLVTVGTSWSCAAAKAQAGKLIGDRIHNGIKNVPLTNGPRGLHCMATPNSTRGHATAGVCFKGTFAFPGTGFSWAEK